MSDAPMDDGLSTLLRDRVATERPDLDILTRAATIQGTRIRRRRRAGVAIGAAASVAAVLGVGAALAGGSSTSADGSGFAAGPSSTAPSSAALPKVGDRLRLPSGAVAIVLDPASVGAGPVTVVTLQGGRIRLSALDDVRPVLLLRPPAGDALTAERGRMAPSDRTYLESTYPGVRIVFATSAKPHRGGAGSPVTVTAPGWTCTPPADEKFGCTRGATTVTVDWRPAREHSAYLDPGKADVLPDVHTFVSDVHGQWFATVAPSPGAGQADVDAIGHALSWR